MVGYRNGYDYRRALREKSFGPYHEECDDHFNGKANSIASKKFLYEYDTKNKTNEIENLKKLIALKLLNKMYLSSETSYRYGFNKNKKSN